MTVQAKTSKTSAGVSHVRRVPGPAARRKGVLGSLVSATVSWFSGTSRRVLGDYELLNPIGEGGMGVIHHARDVRTGASRAVKLQKPDQRSAQQRLRFAREIEVTSALRHPNIVELADHGETSDGVLFYAMELLEGGSLEQVVESSGPLSTARALHVLRGVASALSAVHAQGFVHRDLKPSNVFLCGPKQADQVKLLDFGLVKDLSADEAGDDHKHVLGTPQYLAPEAIVAPTEVGAAADLYAFGALAYFLLSGQSPFSGSSVIEICCQHVNSAVVPPSARAVRPIPPELEALVLACLEKEPARRPPSAEAVFAELSRIAETHGGWSEHQARRWWRQHAEAVATGSERAISNVSTGFWGSGPERSLRFAGQRA